MRIGVTYDLRKEYLAAGFTKEQTAEFDRPETIDAIANAITAIGHQVDRIGNLQNLMQRLLNGDRWDLVFNIAEGLYGLGREAQVPALLDAYQIPYTFSDPLVLSLTLHKGMAKQVVRDAGVPTPDFFVIERESDIAQVRLPFPVFVKPVAEGTGKGITAASRVTDSTQLNLVCRQLLRMFQQPVLVETYLPGREFTVGITGTGPDAKAIGAMEVVLAAHAEPGAYSFENKEHYKGRVDYQLAAQPIARVVNSVALNAWRSLNCRDAGRVDIRLNAAGRPMFLEVNPLAGLDPERSDLSILCGLVGISYQSLIAGIVDSALRRIDHAGTRKQLGAA